MDAKTCQVCDGVDFWPNTALSALLRCGRSRAPPRLPPARCPPGSGADYACHEHVELSPGTLHDLPTIRRTHGPQAG